MNHEYFMAYALQLARKGLYTTSPNPRVGCVIVKDDQIIGQGWHQQAGGPHAEIHALNAAGAAAQGATAYVTLEPCSHYGRTPPCAEALIKAGIKTVVGACTDPNPAVASRGYDLLRQAGIEVITPCLSGPASELNAGFFKRMRSGLPHVRVKLAQSLDGRTAMASGESQWITGAAARQDVQRLRAQSCAIITGADSVLIDNPSMTVRPEEANLAISPELMRQPLRVIIDGQNRLTGKEKIFYQSGAILIASKNAEDCQLSRSHDLGPLHIWADSSPQPKVDLLALLQELARLGCNYVLVESGAQLAGAFVQQHLVDELVLYCAPTFLGSHARPLLALPFKTMDEQLRGHWQDVRMLGNDLRLTLKLTEN